MTTTWHRSCLRAGLAALAVLVTFLAAARVQAEPLRRSAVIVGANAAAPGRKPLRYSEQDARAFASVLIELGGFAPADVQVLIDPEPSHVLATLDQALAKSGGDSSLLVFYYSGHADASSLYPHGRPLSFADLRTRLSDRRAAIRLGIIDACRGGGFTGAKGLTEVAPFEVTLPMALESEGSVLIASSSGLEDAHESELLGGSYFTHHWNAGLRGAGDRNADGQVTLAEAFDYAKTRTVRDSARETAAAQHPSFSLNLRGRQDLALSKLASADAIVELDQRDGPLELFHLSSGVMVLELPRGPRTLRLALAPGEYLVRRRVEARGASAGQRGQGGEVWTHELRVETGDHLHVDESALELYGPGALAIKRSPPRPLTLTTLPRGKQEATFWLGVSYQDFPGFATVGRGFEAGALFPRGLTHRLQWLLPTLALAYRAGEHGGVEYIPAGGILGWGWGYSSIEGFVLTLSPGLSMHVRKWTSPRTALTFGLAASSYLRWNSDQRVLQDPDGTPRDVPKFAPPDSWRTALSVGATHTLGDTVTLHFSLGLARNLLFDGAFTDWHARDPRGGLALQFGAVQTVGLRPSHLVQIHVSDYFAINLDAALEYRFANKSLHESYLAGASFVW